MSSSKAIAGRPAAFVFAGLFFVTGCLSPTYTIERDELVRLAMTPPDQRGARVRVTQQLGTADSPPPVSSGPPAAEVTVGAVVVGNAGHHSHRHRHHDHPRHRSDRRSDHGAQDNDHDGEENGDDEGGDGNGDGDGDDDAAIALLVVGAAVGVTLAATEGSRFDGWASLSPGYPVHLIGPDGSYAWMPLEALDMQFANWAEHAVIAEGEGNLTLLERAPLNRVGFAFDFDLGIASAPVSEDDVDARFSGRIGLGVFPAQQFGLVFGLGITFADPGPDWRPFVELQAFPLQLGRLHVGPYLQGGYAFAAEDERTNQSLDGWFFGGGGIVQLDVTTRFAFTLRGGVAMLTAADDMVAAPEMHLGFSVY